MGVIFYFKESAILSIRSLFFIESNLFVIGVPITILYNDENQLNYVDLIKYKYN